LRRTPANSFCDSLRSFGSFKVMKMTPVLTPVPPKPPATANARTTSGRLLTNVSARCINRSLSSKLEPTADCSRTKRRLWSCDGTNSPGNPRSANTESTSTLAAPTSTSSGRRSARASVHA
jgi:hypothetical protein